MKLKFIIVLSLLFFIKSYAKAATFEFEPATATYTRCENTIHLVIDTTGEESNAADIEIFFDPDIISIQDQNFTQAGVQIKEGSAYTKYWGNISDNNSGRILLAGGSLPDSSKMLSSRKKFAEIPFIYGGQGENPVNFIIRFDGLGNTLDSNIAKSTTGDDILDSVINGVYVFNTGNKCLGQVKRKKAPSTYTLPPVTISPILTTTMPSVTLEPIPCPGCQTATVPYLPGKDQTQNIEESLKRYTELNIPSPFGKISISFISLLCCCLSTQIIILLLIIVKRRKRKDKGTKKLLVGK